MSTSLQNAVEKFIALRDKKKDLVAQHKEELKPLNEAMLKIEAAVQNVLLKQGAQNIKTTAGTAYLSKTTKASVVDWSVFKPYMIEHDLLDMMEHRVSKDAVVEFAEEHGHLPPGIDTNETLATRFKR